MGGWRGDAGGDSGGGGSGGSSLTSRLAALQAAATYWRDFRDGDTDMTGWVSSGTAPTPVQYLGLPLKDNVSDPDSELFLLLPDDPDNTARTLITVIKMEPELDVPAHAGSPWNLSWRAISVAMYDQDTGAAQTHAMLGVANAETGGEGNYYRAAVCTSNDTFGETMLGANPVVLYQTWGECAEAAGAPFGDKVFSQGLLINTVAPGDYARIDMFTTIGGDVHDVIPTTEAEHFRTNRIVQVLTEDYTRGDGPAYVHGTGRVGYLQFFAVIDRALTAQERQDIKEGIYGA